MSKVSPASAHAYVGACFTHRRFSQDTIMTITKIENGRIYFSEEGKRGVSEQSVTLSTFDLLFGGWVMDKEAREAMRENAEDAKKQAQAAKAEEDEALLQRSFREKICFAVTGHDMDEAIRIMELAAEHAYQKGLEEGRRSATPSA